MNLGEDNRVDHFAVCHSAGCYTHANPVNPVIVSSTSYVYDQYGRQIEIIDVLNQSTYTVYDLRGSVVKQYGATYPVWYEYDVHGRMIKMATTRDTTLDPATVDSLDHPALDVTRWNYDPATGLLVQKLYDDGKGPSYTYTPDGKLATRTWARGIVTSYAYDALGSLLSVNYSDATPDVSYTYDRLGHQLSAIAAGVSTNFYAYSTNTLELVAETQNGVVINRSRDVFGRESGLALEADYDVSYTFDAFGRFSQVSNFQFQVSYSYSYMPGSSLVSGMTASTGHAWTRSYESQRNLITSVTNSFNGNLISAFDYANDALGRRTARLDFHPAGVAITNAFGYNVRSEVTSANMGSNAYGYVFDPIGNRTTATNNADVTSYAANELNQYTNIFCASTPPREPSHDDDGNILTNGVWSYSWDGENRLRSVSSNNVLVATYSYDHQSRRVGKFSHEDAKTRSYVHDGWNLIQELTHSQTHTLTNSYTWGLDLSGSLQGAGGVGGLLAVVQDSATYVPAWDANGNVTEYSSTDGAIAAHYEYSPFGETVIQTGAMADAFSYRFSTKYWEDETKLYFYGYRVYTPSVGRWLSRDLIGEVGGWNLYAFVQNKPINQHDLLGLKCSTISGPTVSVPDWELDGVDIESQTASYTALIDGVDVIWKLEGEVECCCRFLFFFSRQVTKTVYKTINKPAPIPRSNFPIIAYAPGNLPISIPTPTTIAQGIGELLGQAANSTLGNYVGFFVTEEDASTIANGVAASKPGSLDEGEWPEDPCN